MVNAQQEPQAPWDLTKLRPVLQLFLRQLMEMGRGRDPSPRLRSSLAECVERASNMLHLYVVVVEIAGSVKPFNPAAELCCCRLEMDVPRRVLEEGKPAQLVKQWGFIVPSGTYP